MKVYVNREDGLELVGHAELGPEAVDTHVVDLAMPGTGAALRLTYVIRDVPWLTPDLRLIEERAVVLAVGQTPDFLPGWECAPPEED